MQALAALDTNLLIDKIRGFLFIRVFFRIFRMDTAGGAFFRAHAAPDALCRIDFKADKFLALARPAFFIVDMLKVLVAVFPDCG
jgi:hypothetical protein